MKKLTVILMVVALGALLATSALAFGPGKGRGDGYCRETGWAKINLTDEQKTKIEARETAFNKEIKPVREKMFDKSVQLRRLWLEANPDKDKIASLQKEVRALRDEMQDKATNLRLEIRRLLTPEQQEKLVNSRWGKRAMGFGPRGGMRGPDKRGTGMGICE